MKIVGDAEKINYYFHRSKTQQAVHSTKHYHDTYELYYLCRGSCCYFIGDSSYELGEGDLVIIPDGVIHRTVYKNNTTCRLLINFPKSILSKELIDNLPRIDIFYRNPALTSRIEDIFLKIEDEYGRGDELSLEALRCYTTELLLLILRNRNSLTVKTVGTPFIEESVKYIQQNYMSQIKLGELARMAAVSAEHFSRTFKKETGFCFNEYLTLVRLQRAEYMLKNEPGKSVGEIAFACGFNDSNYFSLKFRESYGYPPSYLRRSGKQ